MNNTDAHPRILSLSSATTTPTLSTSATPSSHPHTRRASHESAHDAHHFIAMQEEKTHHSLNASIKKMWKEIKHHAAEHHKSVNAAYAASYGAGVTPVR
jgi:tRNA A37 threonylcarbamoyladenosine synthetase subunit TsaC/SUA5/YrdC